MRWMVTSAMFFLSLALRFLSLQGRYPVGELIQAAQPCRVAHPRGVVVEWEHARISALLDRARDQRAGRNFGAVGDPDVAVDHRRAADLAVPPDVGAARDAGAGGD